MEEYPVKLRVNEPPEELKKMRAHAGKCKYCRSPVKMLRDTKTGQLLPDCCFCLLCGQRYYMVIKDIDTWEVEQWKQKD